VKSHAQYWECKDCQCTNCESQNSESKVKCKMFGFVSAKGNNDGSKDRSENWGRV
jgi:hypothetical protein